MQTKYKKNPIHNNIPIALSKYSIWKSFTSLLSSSNYTEIQINFWKLSTRFNCYTRINTFFLCADDKPFRNKRSNHLLSLFMRNICKYLKTSKNQITKGNSPVKLKLSVYDCKKLLGTSSLYNHFHEYESLGMYINAMHMDVLVVCAKYRKWSQMKHCRSVVDCYTQCHKPPSII